MTPPVPPAGFRQGYIGNTTSSIAGCCHTFSADGRCVTLLKVLMSNCCVYDCAYCVNRRSNDTRRAAFTPQELADLTINFYRRNYIEGLFLSSGVLRNPDYTMEQMIRAIRILREEYRFNGYIHAKAIPGAAPELVEQLGQDCGLWPRKRRRPLYWLLCGKSKSEVFKIKKNWSSTATRPSSPRRARAPR